MPVIQARALELPVVDFKPHRPDQVKPGAGGRAGAGDISGVLRDFRFHQYNVECCHVFHSPRDMPDFSFAKMHGHYTINRQKPQNFAKGPETNGIDIHP